MYESPILLDKDAHTGILMIACSGIALGFPEVNHNDPRLKTEGHYGSPKVPGSIPLQVTINLFTNRF